MKKYTFNEISDIIYSDELIDLDFSASGFDCWVLGETHFEFTAYHSYSNRINSEETILAHLSWYCYTINKIVPFSYVYERCSDKEKEIFLYYFDVFNTPGLE